MKFIKKQKPFLNNSGFLAADFLFSFVLVIGCGIIIFALTFSLATVEVAQYITWSAARAYSAGNLTQADSELAGRTKFKNLALKFPLLTGADGNSSWFTLSLKVVGDTAYTGLTGPVDEKNKSTGAIPENRQPWTGVSAELEWKLFKSIQLPFLGKIAAQGSDTFTFPIRAFLLRNPSQEECLQFYADRFDKGILHLNEGWKNNNLLSLPQSYVPIEDNGC